MLQGRGATDVAAKQHARTAGSTLAMTVYCVIDVIGTSTTSWEEAVTRSKRRGQSVRDLRVAEVVKQDIHVGDGGELIYRTKIRLSFNYEQES
jgi:flavin-binding protein dodecin